MGCAGSISSEGLLNMTIKIVKDEDDDDDFLENDIYFLDNMDYEDRNRVRHFHNNLKELNEFNVELFIDEKKMKFKKSFKFEKEGEFKIKIIINESIKNCLNMFYNCKYLTQIDLSSFNTDNVINMSGMFHGCTHL